jgi:hypothetical protein
MAKLAKTYLQITIPIIILIISVSELYSNNRILIGIDLFPSFLASDQNIHNKIGEDKQLHIVIAYQYDQNTAIDMANRLKDLGKIRGIPIKVYISTENEIEYSKDQNIAGIFIAESMIPLRSIIKKSIEQSFIVFSPFEGDVEKGVTGGMYITDRIVPYINVKTLLLAKINMKSFFFKVSKQYE